MENLLNKLKDWVKVIQTALLGTIIIEGVLVIVIGVASNKIGETLNYWTGILISCSLVYLFILTVKAAYQVKFPVSIVDELISKRELEEKVKLLDRQKAINEYITTTIQGLNKQTCVIPNDIKHLCDKELQERLTELLQPIVSYTDVLLDTSIEKKFTIGIHLDSYQKFPADYNAVELSSYEETYFIKNWDQISDQGILILRDELQLSQIIPKELVNVDKVNGASYEIQTAIKRTLNNLIFNTHDFSFKQEEYTIICSEILEVCSDNYVNGVLFIIFKRGLKFPTDVPDVLRIFNRVTSNYVSKYNSCIKDEIIRQKRKVEKIEENKTAH